MKQLEFNFMKDYKHICTWIQGTAFLDEDQKWKIYTECKICGKPIIKNFNDTYYQKEVTLKEILKKQNEGYC